MGLKVRVEGLKEFRREVKRLDASLGKELRQVHLKVSEMVAGRARAAAPSSVKSAVRAKATQKVAQVQVLPKPPRALGVFMGARGRFGWYSAPRYRASSGRQFEPWVGNQWDPGEAAGSPYFIGPAINASVDDVVRLYGEGIEELARRVFPD